MRIMIFAAIFYIFLIGCTSEFQEPVEYSELSDPQGGKVSAIFIIDGDSFISRGDSVVFRLWGIDAPELGQPWGNAAKASLIALIHKRQAEIVIKGESYGRPVVQMSIGGKDVALEMLKMGLAWYTPEYAPKEKEYLEAEKEARAAKRGLWSAQSVSPKEWRKRY